MGRNFVLAVANPIYVSNSYTKFGWIPFNGKGEDSLTDCDDVRKYLEIFLFFSKSLTCLPFASECVCWFNLDVLFYIDLFKGELHNLALTCKYFGFHQVYRQYWNKGFFKQVHAPTYPLLRPSLGVPVSLFP